jgi:hypothetical protein
MEKILKHVFVIQLPDTTLKALPITNMEKAKQLESDYKTMKWQGLDVAIRGVMSEEDFQGLQTFWHVPAFDRLKHSVEYFKKHGKWPNTGW